MAVALPGGAFHVLEHHVVNTVCTNTIYHMAENFGGKIFWQIAEIMTFGGIYFGG